MDGWTDGRTDRPYVEYTHIEDGNHKQIICGVILQYSWFCACHTPPPPPSVLCSLLALITFSHSSSSASFDNKEEASSVGTIDNFSTWHVTV